MHSEVMSLDLGPPTTANVLRINAFDVPSIQDSNPNFRNGIGLSFDRFDINADENDIVAIGVSQKTKITQCVAKHLVPVALLPGSLVGVCHSLGSEAGLNDSHLRPPSKLFPRGCCLEGFDVIGIDGGPWSNVKGGRFQRSSQIPGTRSAAFAKFEVEFILVHATSGNSEKGIQFEVDLFKEDFELGRWNQKVRVSSWL